MTALRMRARDVLSEDELVAVRERFTRKGVAMIVHAWALIIAAIALVAWCVALMDRCPDLSTRRRHHRLASAGTGNPDA